VCYNPWGKGMRDLELVNKVKRQYGKRAIRPNAHWIERRK
jgi:hypothetical protein